MGLFLFTFWLVGFDFGGFGAFFFCVVLLVGSVFFWVSYFVLGWVFWVVVFGFFSPFKFPSTLSSKTCALLHLELAPGKQLAE